MEEDLYNLIRTLEAEQATLQELKDAAVDEQDYRSAHLYLVGLGQIGRQLQLLRNIEDPDYDAKTFIHRRRLYLKSQIEEAQGGQYSDFLKKQLLYYEEQLQRLHRNAQLQEKQTDQDLLQEQIDLLLEDKIRSFSIILSQKTSIKLQIDRISSGLKVILSDENLLREHHVQSLKTKTKLQSLGFALSESGDEFIITLNGTVNEVRRKLMQQLARLIFEVFSFKDSRGKAYIISD